MTARIMFVNGDQEEVDDFSVEKNGWVKINQGGKNYDLLPATSVERIIVTIASGVVKSAPDRTGYHKYGTDAPVVSED